MATPVTKYIDVEGNEFATEAEADASSTALAGSIEVRQFIAANYPMGEGKTRNPSATIALAAILKWEARNNPVAAE